MCKTFINIGIWKTLETLTTLVSSDTKLSLPSWLLVFRHEERERHNFLLCWLFHLSPPRAAHLVDLTSLASPRLKNQLASPRSESQLTAFFFFRNHPKSSAHRFQAWRHSHPVPISIQGFYYDICDCHILPARAWTPALNVCPYLCTKPNSSCPN